MELISIPYVSISPNRITTYWRKQPVNSGLVFNSSFLDSVPAEVLSEQLKFFAKPIVNSVDEIYSKLAYEDHEQSEKQEIRRPPKFVEHTGIISKKAKKKINNAIDWLLLLANDKTVYSTKSKKKFKFKISFVTLTLASAQRHSDNEIKKELLNHFLVEARKKWKVDKYVWRAEKQMNGNIHFHIVVDKFINYDELRNVWNRIQNKLGYVDEYQKNQKEFFKNGFKFRPVLSKNWSYAKQRKAYYKALSCNFTKPNSTDIHSVKGIKNLSSYLSKYCTKNPEFELQIEPIVKTKSYAFKPVIPVFEQMKPIKVYKEQLVTGKSWGLSQSLSKMKNLVLERDSFVDAELEVLADKYQKQIYVSDFFVTLKIHFNQWKDILFGHLRQLFTEYLEQARNDLEAENLKIIFNL